VRILQICHRVPYPPLDGGNIAMLNMAMALDQAGNEVHVFALNTSKHFVRPEDFPGELSTRLHFRQTYIDTSIRIRDAFFNLFSNRSYNIDRFINEKVRTDLVEVLQNNSFDIVQLETLYSTGYIDTIRKYSKAKIVLRAHNAENIIWHRLSNSEKNPVKKTYLSFLARRLKNYELEILKKVDAIVPITSVDEIFFTENNFEGPICTLPLGVDLADYPVSNLESDTVLFHLGSMDWLPNVEGVKWFLRECWPLIHREFPELKLYLAGRNFPDDIRLAGHPNVICEGRIENANDYISSKQLMIVPLLSGSGMRVKIIQGLALKKTIISTTIGAEGIAITDGENILLADTSTEFLDQVSKCIADKQWCKSIGNNGRKLIEEQYSNEAIGKQLTSFFESLITSDTVKKTNPENLTGLVGI
jgi:polysaccharide biosynthesis protein PslH